MKVSKKTRKAINRVNVRIITDEVTFHGQDRSISKEIRFYGDPTDLDTLIDFIYACGNG